MHAQVTNSAKKNRCRPNSVCKRFALFIASILYPIDNVCSFSLLFVCISLCMYPSHFICMLVFVLFISHTWACESHLFWLWPYYQLCHQVSEVSAVQCKFQNVYSILLCYFLLLSFTMKLHEQGEDCTQRYVATQLQVEINHLLKY